ncbi:hypothetical protein FRB99_003732 [Tulasnella sp. 403]|nr:hypothetical protein FRB99_003732 [Tulasnella sp. 403]
MLLSSLVIAAIVCGGALGAPVRRMVGDDDDGFSVSHDFTGGDGYRHRVKQDMAQPLGEAGITQPEKNGSLLTWFSKGIENVPDQDGPSDDRLTPEEKAFDEWFRKDYIRWAHDRRSFEGLD